MVYSMRGTKSEELSRVTAEIMLSIFVSNRWLLS